MHILSPVPCPYGTYILSPNLRGGGVIHVAFCDRLMCNETGLEGEGGGGRGGEEGGGRGGGGKGIEM